MSGFVRRFTSFPPQAVLQAIEGINIIDLPPPTTPQGISENVIALVGEFVDCTYAVAVDASGNITTNPQPVEIFGGQDLLNKLGGFDSTIGAFGASMGNGYVELRNKSFGRLIVVPINLASAAGIRMWRNLPTNASATNPSPVVPLSAATVPAGYALKDNAHALERINTAGPVNFSADVAYLTGIDGAVTNGVSAATQIFSSPGGTFTTVLRPDGGVGVHVGDILVAGVVGLAGAQGDDAGTYRVVTIDSDTQVHVQQLSGANFAWTTSSSALAWRLHPAKTADSYGEGLLTSQGTYTVPVRPLTNDAGSGASNTDGTWATGTALVPVTTPAALTATTADPLSGLAAAIGPTTAVPFTSAVQRPNAPSATGLDTLYATAIDALLHDEQPEADVVHVWSARKSASIRTKLKAHEIAASKQGVGRTASLSPELNLTTSTALATVGGDADPGVGANRDESAFYHWPPVKTYIPEAVGINIATADGQTTADGILDTTGDGWVSSILGNLDPYRNPGEATATTKGVLQPVLGYARGVPKLDINAWEYLKAKGIAGIRMDRTSGPVVQSGVTSSLADGTTSIARRRMANFVEDSLAVILAPFSKLPLSNQVMDGALNECVDFLEVLLSSDNAANQQIAAYSVDDKSGNTKESLAAGIFVIIVKVRTLASADFIVIQAEISPNTVVTTQQ